MGFYLGFSFGLNPLFFQTYIPLTAHKVWYGCVAQSGAFSKCFTASLEFSGPQRIIVFCPSGALLSDHHRMMPRCPHRYPRTSPQILGTNSCDFIRNISVKSMVSPRPFLLIYSVGGGDLGFGLAQEYAQGLNGHNFVPTHEITPSTKPLFIDRSFVVVLTEAAANVIVGIEIKICILTCPFQHRNASAASGREPVQGFPIFAATYSGVCGRDGDKEEIVKFLLSHNASGNKISVIALVGMGGIGKTTLAQVVYNDRKVVECFALKAWVCVSDEFDLVRITKTIVKAIDSGTSKNSSDDNDLNLLQLKLKERLSGKKFFLVLDDVWNENYNNWDRLQTPFTVGLPGSKIIVTTRSDKVASVMRSVRIHHLGQLSFDDCWSLFAKHAFENGDSSLHPELQEIGKEIVKKCEGLPLAAKTLGGALYSESRVEEWENVLNSETWDLANDEILPALRLSYSFLPSHLKQCFAYCSIFPKDYEFEKENLILLWMAEGFLDQSASKKTMEKVGDGYFYGLVSRSFFQKSSSHKSYFVMHDLINDLAQLVSGKFCVQLKDGKMNEIPEKFRHLSYFIILNDLISKVQYLRVLSLSYYGIIDLSDTIGNLKHLRYLDLSYTSIKRLPDSVCSLYNLQTLILSFCKYPVELPIMMCKLIRLRHLDIRHSSVKEMPSQLCQLKSLQKLTNYRVDKKSGTRVGELRELSHIGGILRIKELQNVVDGRDASETNLVGKQYLNDLRLEWNDDDGVDQNGADIVLNNLQPHSNLKRLTIQGYGGLRFPDWLGGPAMLMINMVSLRLWLCKNVSAFPPLGQLPSLKHLYINGAEKVERVGAEFYGTDPSSTKPSFVSLKALSFVYMPKWKEWLCLGGQGGEFPRLKELYIHYCPKLTGNLPDHLPLLDILDSTCNSLCFPLSIFPRLTSLRIYKVRGLESLSFSISEGDPTSFKYLSVSGCPDLVSIELPALNFSLFFIVDCCENLKSLLHRAPCFQSLILGDCPEVIFPIQGLPSNLSSLSIRNCEKFRSQMELGLQGLTSLRHFDIESQCEDLELFPKECLLPSTLTSLKISRLPNLKSLDSKGLQLLTTLQKLEISYCPKLQSLTEERLPTSLSFLTIENCPLLKDRCKVGTGEDWHHMAHIPHITIDGQLFLEFLNIAGGFWQLSNHFNSLQELFSDRLGELLRRNEVSLRQLKTFAATNPATVWRFEAASLELASSGNDNQCIVVEPAFLAASFEVDGPHSCCEGHSLVTSPEQPPRSQVCNLAWSRNVNELVSTHGYSQNQIMVWKHPSMTKVTTLTGHSLLVLYLAMSWDGQPGREVA
ncbi:unnamed protein product, partial [Vitis vinifera]